MDLVFHDSTVLRSRKSVQNGVRKIYEARDNLPQPGKTAKTGEHRQAASQQARVVSTKVFPAPLDRVFANNTVNCPPRKKGSALLKVGKPTNTRSAGRWLISLGQRTTWEGSPPAHSVGSGPRRRWTYTQINRSAQRGCFARSNATSPLAGACGRVGIAIHPWQVVHVQLDPTAGGLDLAVQCVRDTRFARRLRNHRLSRP